MFIGRLDTAEEAMGVENLIHLALPEENDLKLYKLFLDRHPMRNSMERIIAVEDGIVVAHAMLIPRTLMIDGSLVEADDVGFVATHPAYRQRGIMSALMKKTMRYIEERKKPMSFVYGIPYFYRKFGYEYAIPDDTYGPYTTVPVPKSKSGKKFSTRPAKPGDMEKMTSFYGKNSPSTTLHAQRTRTDWLFQEAMISSLSNMETIVIEDGPRFKGYARMQKGGVVREMAVEGLSNKSNVKAYIGALGKSSGASDICFALSTAHPVVEAVANYGGKRPGRLYGGYMKIVSITRLISSMKKTIEDRMRDSGMEDYKGRVLLDIYDQRTTIEIASGKLVAVTDDKRGEPDLHIRLPPGIMVQLATGYKEVLDVADTCDLLASNEGLALLGNLFPKRRPYIDFFDR